MDQGGFNGIFNLITWDTASTPCTPGSRGLLREPLFSNPLLIQGARAQGLSGA